MEELKHPLTPSEELKKLFEQCAKEVDKWPAWARSLDPFGSKQS